MQTQLTSIIRSSDPAARRTSEGILSRGVVLPWTALQPIYRRSRGHAEPVLAWVEARLRSRPDDLHPRSVGPPGLIRSVRDTWGDPALAFLAQTCADVAARVPGTIVSAETWQSDPCAHSVSVFVTLVIRGIPARVLVTPGAGPGGRLIGNLHASTGGPLRLADVGACVEQLIRGSDSSPALAAA